MAIKAPKEKTYKSAYSSVIDDLVNKAINREPFQYDPATDQAYQAYAREYGRLGNEAAQNTLADVAANTGGLASSYATTAAAQARGEYNQQLTNMIPSLMEAAYAKYRDQYNDALSGINVLQGLDDSAYNRFNTDRQYNRGIYESDRDYARSVLESDRQFNESVRQYDQNYDLDKNSAEFERMLNTWATLGYATKKIAKYFGVKEGTKTNEAAYQAAQLALQRANRSSGGGGGGRGGRRGGRGGYGSGYNGEDIYGQYFETPDEGIYKDNAYRQALNVATQKYLNGASYEQIMNYLATVEDLSGDDLDRIMKALGIKDSGYTSQGIQRNQGGNKREVK